MNEQQGLLTDEQLNAATPAELCAEIFRLRAALKGPGNYTTWMDAAVDEKVKRIAAERKLQALRDHIQGCL